MLLAAIALSVPAGGGCASLVDPFLGVPEWQTVRYGEEAPDPALRGLPRITAVEEREYDHYVRSASEGCIVAREVRGDWVYYAVVRRRVVPKPGTGPAAPGRAAAVVYERYRAKQPPRPPPRPSPRLPERKTEDRGDADSTPSDPEMEKLRKRYKEKIRKQLKERGGPRSVLPESAGDDE